MTTQPIERVVTSEVVTLRQAAFLALGSGLSIAGFWLLFQVLRLHGITAAEGVMLGLFILLFSQISFGFSIAFFGFFTRLRGGDPVNIMRTIDDLPTGAMEEGTTAIVMPIFNEETARVFAGIETIVRSVDKTGHGQTFDFFILSDSNQPSQWIDEECAWVDLCRRLKAFGRIFYRKRRVSQHGKSGNIADFCRRWGKRYRYLVILDADSVMCGSTLVRLVRVMDANPVVGIIQTVPNMAMGNSVWQRLFQFSAGILSPLFAAGSNFWHLGGGAYWGHNAIIRLQPFMAHCVLPELPSENRSDRHILSHDTVEAALMHQAGYQVWLASEEPGSYEEAPPNLSESLKRDRRWCQGNLQHTWFLFAPHIRFTNRIHIFFGLMGYLSSPLLMLFIMVSGLNYYWQERFAVLAAQIDEAPSTFGLDDSVLLLMMTVVLLFVPKILGWLTALPRAREFGGVIKMSVGLFLETLFSVFLAPVLLYFHSQFVVLTLLGLRVTWKTQNRNQAGLEWGSAIRTYAGPTVACLLLTTLCLYYTPDLLWWLSPLLLGWGLSIPLAVLSSSESLGLRFRRWGLFLSPEETAPSPELPAIFETIEKQSGGLEKFQGTEGIIDLFLSPYTNSVHLSMLQQHGSSNRLKREYLEDLQKRFIEQGPRALTQREITALVWDAASVNQVHANLWQTEEEHLHREWRRAMRAHHQIIRFGERRSSSQVRRMIDAFLDKSSLRPKGKERRA